VDVRYRLGFMLRQGRVKQVELARALGESENWVSRRVRGETPILADEIARLATALGISPCAFVDEGEFDRFVSTDPHAYQAAQSPSRGIRFATRWADLIEAQIPADDDEAEQLELALLRKMLELKERRLSQKG
jgi:transcriptional regulator with XRE-family HTH domain